MHRRGIAHGHEITVEQDILSENNRVARQNRTRWGAAGCVAINMVSSPGSGKTTLLERTIGRLDEMGFRHVAVIEGDDKPLKYPYMFAGADVCVINKVDLLPYVDSDLARLKGNALKVNRHLRFFETSSTRGTGIDAWCGYLLSFFGGEEVR